MLGNGRCECFCFDGVTRLGHIRGKMRKKVWITAGDIVLVAKRDFQDEKVDIVHKYSADEARNLKQYGELPETARINETAVDMAMAGGDDDDDIGIDFDVRLFRVFILAHTHVRHMYLTLLKPFLSTGYLKCITMRVETRTFGSVAMTDIIFRLLCFQLADPFHTINYSSIL
jgi:translation initiation factor 1A